MKMLLLICVCLVASVVGKESYSGHKLVSMTLTTADQMKVVNDMMVSGEPWLDFWAFPGLNRTGQIRVPPESWAPLLNKALQNGIQVKLIENDVDAYLQRTMSESTASTFSGWQGGYVTHTAYRRYSEFISIMNGLQVSYPSLVKEVGALDTLTYDERELYYIRLGTGTGKPVIFIEGLIHAREWVVGGVMLYFMDRLVSRYSADSDAQYILDNYDVVIVPVANPDGYEYSHTTSRLWRKNRSPQQGSCRGVDGNRNFAADWGNAGVSNNCNSDIYCGPSVFSEAETRALRNKVNEINNEPASVSQGVVSYLAVHSYSQLVLTPYSYANLRPGNAAEIDYVAEQMNDALRAPFGTNYQWGHGPILLYPVSGASDDWAMLGGGVRYSYTYELRPASSNPGFQLPANQIVPNGFEFWQSIVAMACNLDVGEPTCTFQRSTK